jgi:hypothetical protein
VLRGLTVKSISAIAVLYWDARIRETYDMTEIEYEQKLSEIDRLLNDPDGPNCPSEVWALLAEIASHAKTLK